MAAKGALAVVAGFLGVLTFFVARLVFLGGSLDWWDLRTAMDMWPLAVTALICSVPVVVCVRRFSKTRATIPVLSIAGVVAAALSLFLVVFVISGAWVALLQGKPGWSALFAEAFRSGVALLLLAQYVVTGGVFGAGYGWLCGPRASAQQ